MNLWERSAIVEQCLDREVVIETPVVHVDVAPRDGFTDADCEALSAALDAFVDCVRGRARDGVPFDSAWRDAVDVMRSEAMGAEWFPVAVGVLEKRRYEVGVQYAALFREDGA